nr:MAG TPA: Cytadhesin P30/P32 [Caudoviricetes sp.]
MVYFILISVILGLLIIVASLFKRVGIYEQDQRRFVLDLDLARGKAKQLEEEVGLLKAEIETFSNEYNVCKENVKGLNKKVVELKKQIKNGTE